MSEISQDRDDYVSLYDLMEYARAKHNSDSEAAQDLLDLAENKNIPLFKQYGGIKPRIEPVSSTNLLNELNAVVRSNDMELPF
ncbi:hypothetical protein [Phocoenobacter skyensis]|uniref:Uncharacterized protein n=1 Tax=Phocoenobacter skyensis TaxID=97481 RepID=A0A1H7XHU2_9PAST|nr:hypothetical protein [Pasteurella skyensis]MDP8079699.1 hypothetical protein [Pasteurella skyensis]MDP8085601.1 hypothetical protein [Pasteurella skyensis]MDP8185418.1 hypothetical protein [Pasteurella skyensis]QLB22181.1 hypothetical protein A6B44_02790 [Pasteurella skyensis]SEM32599.1 hypothetical protein SAMN05444853_11262 [Pasteurella skyensis]